ncbi:MAG: tetratricopeptide repeat protein [Bacteroidota bacterium]|nr:tetratricopeptide repeat protein [Bacteroidota bacterium]
MKRPQWIAASIAILLTVSLYALTRDQLFGYHPIQGSAASTPAPQGQLTIDTILHHAKERLTDDQLTRIHFLESSISRGDVLSQKLHIYHQLARFWRDTAKIFEPFGWYTAEAARLENSEKSLTFAARLFLQNLRYEENADLRQWKATQSKDLYERSLKVNPGNDSVQVELGEVYVYGGLAMPMEGISMIRTVAEKDPNNLHAQISLGNASLASGQLDKAIERFSKVVQLKPDHLEAVLLLADTYERKGDKAEAIKWYSRSLPIITIPGLKTEVEKRITQLRS